MSLLADVISVFLLSTDNEHAYYRVLVVCIKMVQLIRDTIRTGKARVQFPPNASSIAFFFIKISGFRRSKRDDVSNKTSSVLAEFIRRESKRVQECW